MEEYLITLTVYRRVKPEANDIVRTLEHVRDAKGATALLGRKGSMRRIADPNTYTHEQLMAAAREGLLYREQQRAKAFSPALDNNTGLPLLMEEYDDAFRQRQLDNSKPEQQPMDLKSAD